MRTMTLRNPETPATSKQLWLLHILTKTDTRNLNLTMQQASDRINELKGNGNGKRPLINPHATAIQQDAQLRAQQRYDRQVLTKSTPLFTTTDAEKVIPNRDKKDTKHSNSKRHWGIDTFVQTSNTGTMGLSMGKYGYCSKCFGDMQILSDGIIRHYNSHKYAKALGLWGK